MQSDYLLNIYVSAHKPRLLSVLVREALYFYFLPWAAVNVEVRNGQSSVIRVCCLQWDTRMNPPPHIKLREHHGTGGGKNVRGGECGGMLFESVFWICHD